MSSWKGRAQGYVRDRRGSVAILFGIVVVPLLIAVGVAIDYARIAAVRTKLNHAADLATLASLSKSSQPFVNTPTPAGVETYFDTISNEISYISGTAVQVSIVPSATALAVSLTYTTNVRTVFGGILGINYVEVSGTSTAQTAAPTHVDFYLLLDNSPSMGLAATAADISELQSLTPDNCAFACHQHTYDANGNVTGDDPNDYYHVAQANNVTLRIDVLRQAVQQLTVTAASTEIAPNQYRMGAWEFSDVLTKIADLSGNLSAVGSAAGAIDLAYAWNTNCCAQTSFDVALPSLNAIMPNPGDGSSASSPQEFLFFVTDGVEDETPIPPATPNVTGQNRTISLLNTANCTAIKARGIQIAVLYTPYLPLPTNDFYNHWIAPFIDQIPLNLQSCASPGFYFQVTPSQGIAQAMQAMFQAAITSVALTQ